MAQPALKRTDFDHPSLIFVIEDKIKNLIGSLYYGEEIRRLKLKGDENILDFGCGGGVASLNLVRYLNQNGRLLAVDTAEYWARIAAKRLRKYSNAECRSGDIRTMNLPPMSFDIIVIFHVLHDIIQENRQIYLTALVRLLKGEGKLFLKEPVRSPHGIPVREIRSFLTKTGLSESSHFENKTDYRGVWARIA